MTWKQFAKWYLVNNGMFEDQARAVVALAMAMEDQRFASWQERRNDAIDDTTLTAFKSCLRAVAVDWIKEHEPLTLFKAVFEA